MIATGIGEYVVYTSISIQDGYVLRGLAVDWWSLLKSEWVDLDAFGEEG